MRVSDLVQAIKAQGVQLFTGVPDSQLRPFCDYLMAKEGISHRHLIAANEGNCLAIASGAYLATGRPACVYLQNSGLGNLMNPVCSLTHPKVYALPMILVIGWRGEPGVHDEPQHIYQGKITLESLQLLGIRALVLERTTSTPSFFADFADLCQDLKAGKSVAVVVRKGALQAEEKLVYHHQAAISREAAIEAIAGALPEHAVLVSSTGKISRELFEVRERMGQGHEKDFLTVGSMGHCSSIALGIALSSPKRPVVCLDGDGALLMHMGAMAVIGAQRPANLIHIVLDNGAHETVGGMPTVSEQVDFCAVAKACGYHYTAAVEDLHELCRQLHKMAVQAAGPAFLRVKVKLGARNDLGRPTRTPWQNRDDFMRTLKDR